MSENWVFPVAAYGFTWGQTWRIVQKGQRMFRRSRMPVVFAITDPAGARLVWVKGDRWQVHEWGPPAKVIVADTHAPGWWHEACHILLGNDPRWNNHQSSAPVPGKRNTETIMGVTPNWKRALRLSPTDELVIRQRVPGLAIGY